MNRSTAREIVMRLGFEAAARDIPVSELLDDFFSEEHYDTLAEEDEAFAEFPDDKQLEFRRLEELAYLKNSHGLHEMCDLRDPVYG